MPALLSEPSQSPGDHPSGRLELSHNGLIFYLGTHKPRLRWRANMLGRELLGLAVSPR